LSQKDVVEYAAAASVAYTLGGRAVRRDPGGGASSTRDFDVMFRGGRPAEPLEITQLTDQAIRETWAQLDGLDQDAPSLTRSWTVEMPERRGRSAKRGADPRKFLLAAEPHFAVLERVGLHRLGPELRFVDDPAVRAAALALADLGCEIGFSMLPPDGGPGRICPGAGPSGVGIGFDIGAFEEQAALNAHKLHEPAGAGDRHFFLVVDPSEFRAWSALRFDPPAQLPSLPAPITRGWIGAQASVYFTTHTGWESRCIPEEVWEHPERWIDAASAR
jgi:hypothetical protein